ncbi:MAG: IS4 family transposase, partial [Peptococcaceae bacterium]|nr:IS4 family transposase [Peptococcaceae bacterium]
MIQHNPLSEKYQHQLLAAFSSLKLSQHLRKTGIRKAFGLSSLRIFQIIFQLVFQGRNLFRLLEGPAAESLP